MTLYNPILEKKNCSHKQYKLKLPSDFDNFHSRSENHSNWSMKVKRKAHPLSHSVLIVMFGFLVPFVAAINLAQLKLFRHYYVMVCIHLTVILTCIQTQCFKKDMCLVLSSVLDWLSVMARDLLDFIVLLYFNGHCLYKCIYLWRSVYEYIAFTVFIHPFLSGFVSSQSEPKAFYLAFLKFISLICKDRNYTYIVQCFNGNKNIWPWGVHMINVTFSHSISDLISPKP